MSSADRGATVRSGRPLVALVFTAGTLLAGCSQPATAPTSFTTHNATDQSFQCEHPADWEAEGGGAHGYYHLRVRRGSAAINVTADLVGSLMGDIARSFGQAAGVSEERLSPVALLHEKAKEEMAENYGSFQEQAATKMNTGFGETYRSEFTGSGSFGGKTHGYRATALARDRRIICVCTCPESDWQTLKPAFEKVIESLTAGR